VASRMRARSGLTSFATRTWPRWRRTCPGCRSSELLWQFLGGGTATLDIPARTVLGPTSSVLPVGSLARAALPFLVNLTEEESEAIDDLLTDEGAQGDLFDDIEGSEQGSRADVAEETQRLEDEE